MRNPLAYIAKMQYRCGMTWVVEMLDDRVREELEVLPDEMKARFRRIVMKGKDGISRAIYRNGERPRVVVIRVFVKKTRKTPKREIDLALARAKEVK